MVLKQSYESGNIFVSYKSIGFAVMAILFGIVTLLSFLTYRSEIHTSNKFILFALSNHALIMVAAIGISVAFGYVLSASLYKELQQQSQASKQIMDVVLRFLGTDERKIIKHLVEHDGKSKQYEISRIHGLNKVKVHRSLQKLQEKKIISIVPHGKIRIIELKSDILEILKKKDFVK